MIWTRGNTAHDRQTDDRLEQELTPQEWSFQKPIQEAGQQVLSMQFNLQLSRKDTATGSADKTYLCL